MLARMREFLRTANQKAAAKRKHAKLAARRRDALANVKETLRQWRAAEDKCNCHDFTCWREVWELDPFAATALRASNHHVHGCHMKQTCPEDKLDFLCPQCGLVLLQPSREHDSHLERHSDCTESTHSSDTGESVESLGEAEYIAMFHSVTSPTAGASCELYLAIQICWWMIRCYRARVKGNRLALRNALATSLHMGSTRGSSSSASSPLACIVRPLSKQVCSMVATMQREIAFIGRNSLSTISWASADCQVPSLGAPVASGRQPSTNLSSRRLGESITKRMSSF